MDAWLSGIKRHYHAPLVLTTPYPFSSDPWSDMVAVGQHGCPEPGAAPDLIDDFECSLAARPSDSLSLLVLVFSSRIPETPESVMLRATATNFFHDLLLKNNEKLGRQAVNTAIPHSIMPQ
jgi:hypothetical protein